MGRPVPMPTREQIVHRHEAGESLRTIAADVERSPATVRRRYRDHGWEGLAPNYAACGLKGPQCSARIYRGAVWLKRAHPKWGARLIRMLLAEKWPQAYMPHERTLQRWFRQAGLQRRRGQQPHRYHGRGEAPHGVWAMDAKENIRLASGARVSWLIISDEASGAVLAGAISPLVSWSQVEPHAVKAFLQTCFAQWGLPQKLRVDHGQPWGTRAGLPTALAFGWWA